MGYFDLKEDPDQVCALLFWHVDDEATAQVAEHSRWNCEIFFVHFMFYVVIVFFVICEGGDKKRIKWN